MGNELENIGSVLRYRGKLINVTENVQFKTEAVLSETSRSENEAHGLTSVFQRTGPSASYQR